MAKLTSAGRAALSNNQYAGPGRSFPINDKNHARAALSMVGRSEAKGSISPSAAATVRAKAKAKLAKSK